MEVLIGVAASKGLYHDKTRELVRKYVASGHSSAAVKATLHGLLRHGTQLGWIPPNAGKQTEELCHRAAAGIRRCVDEYVESRGYLVPRVLSGGDLEAKLRDYWFNTWGAPIPPGPELKATEGLDERMCLAAQLVAKTVKAKARYTNLGSYTIEEDDLEGICRAVVKDVMRAFNDASGVNDELVHAS